MFVGFEVSRFKVSKLKGLEIPGLNPLNMILIDSWIDRPFN
jgi:hypothetical protein